jgi:hypothetical protein
MRTHPNLSLLEECFAKGRDLGIGREYIFLIILLLVCENFNEVQHLFPLAPESRRIGDGCNKA